MVQPRTFHVAEWSSAATTCYLRFPSQYSSGRSIALSRIIFLLDSADPGQNELETPDVLAEIFRFSQESPK